MSRPLPLGLALMVAAGIGTAIWFRDYLAAESLTAWIAGFGIVAPLVFAAARIVGAVVLVPGSVMGIVAGAAFGVVPGAIYNLIASTLGSVAAFVIARAIAPDWIRTRIRDRETVERLVSGVEAEGWRFVAFVRLVPLFPYNIVNYALGLTRINLWHYTAATFVCMIPGDLAYVYMGYAAREALGGNERAWQLGLSAVGFLAALALLPGIVRRLRRGRSPSA